MRVSTDSNIGRIANIPSKMYGLSRRDRFFYVEEAHNVTEEQNKNEMDTKEQMNIEEQN